MLIDQTDLRVSLRILWTALEDDFIPFQSNPLFLPLYSNSSLHSNPQSLLAQPRHRAQKEAAWQQGTYSDEMLGPGS